ncbi:MAG: GNAT family N-acetyltransferase [Fusobacteriota bacterium]
MNHIGGIKIIKEAQKEDLEDIVKNNFNMAYETENIKLDKEKLTLGVSKLIDDPQKGRYYVYKEDDQVLGQLMITTEWSDWRNGDIWWIQSVYVKKKYRDQGIFKKLYKKVENIVNNNEKICGLRLYVEKENDLAKKVYEKMGMQKSYYEIYEKIK